MTLANLLTDELEGGPQALAFVTTAQMSAGVITSLTGGNQLAIAFPADLFQGTDTEAALKAILTLMERAWKFQQINYPLKDAFKKRTQTKVTGSYMDGDTQLGRKYGAVTTHSVESMCEQDQINESVIRHVEDVFS